MDEIPWWSVISYVCPRVPKVAVETKTIIVSIATKQPHFASSKKSVKTSGFSVDRHVASFGHIILIPS
jgi:hypothetical protein